MNEAGLTDDGDENLFWSWHVERSSIDFNLWRVIFNIDVYKHTGYVMWVLGYTLPRPSNVPIGA